MMMKNIIKAIIILSTPVLLSCGNSFLDKNDPTRLNSGSFYQTETHFLQAMSGVYSQLQDYTSNAWQYCEFISDNTTLHFNTGDRGQAPGLEALEYWQINTTTLEQIGPYNIYAGIFGYLANINIILSKLPAADLSESFKNNVEAQMKFMRAYYYFQLVQLFGDVIIVTEQITNPDDAWDYSRSPAAEVYQLIDSDIKFAVDMLPATVSNTNIGRPTKGAALALQGRIFLVRKQYSDAVNAFRQVTQLGYSILPDYAQVFDPTNKNHKESVMEVQFQGNNDLGEYSGFIYRFYPRESYGAVIPFTGRSGEGWNIPTLDIIGDYEDGDLRKDVSLKEGYTNNSDVWVPVPFINKYNHPHSIEGRPNDNWPLIRYAEVLLSLAEAINEVEGPTGETFDLLNQIRTRAGLQPVSGLSKDDFRKKVLHERRIELAFENHRWFDLKRTMSNSELVAFLNEHGRKEMNKPTTPERASMPFVAGDYEFVEYELLLPIPSREIRLNPLVKQTPGY